MTLKRLVNRAAVREAFHRQGARIPRGFLAEVEREVYVVLRRAAAGGIEPSPEPEPAEELYLKQSLLKEALREALGTRRVDTAWVGHLNAVVVSKVSGASVRSGAKAGAGPRTPGVPGKILRAFLRSADSKTTSVSAFFRRWQDPGFRGEWIGRAKYKGRLLDEIKA